MTPAPVQSVANELILASAGTGKTFTLSSRYLRLLVDGVLPARILATTFTRKAAGEILDRVVIRLAKAAGDSGNASELASELGRPGVDSARFGEILAGLMTQLNHVQVQTLDSFFARLARSFSLELGLGPDWQIVDEVEMQQIGDHAIRMILGGQNVNNLVHDLSHGEASRKISEMVRDLVSNVYSIYRECADSGTLEAWDAIQEQKMAAPDEIANCVADLRATAVPNDRMRKALDRNLEFAEAADWQSFLKDGIAKKVAENDYTFHHVPLPQEVVNAMRSLTHHAAVHWINLVAKHTRAAKQMLERFHKELDCLKREEGAREFADLSYLAGQLLRDRGMADFAWRLDRQVDHLLLDEFQDTSAEQWQILRPVAMHTSRPDSGCSFFCVGDIKQAIYGWRGGVAGIFDDVIAELGPRLGETGQLNSSHRSSPQVIELVNTVFGQMGAAVKDGDLKNAVSTWCDRFPVHETHRKSISGYAAVESTDLENHIGQVALRIRDIAAAYPGMSIGVLARTNNEIAQTIFQLGLLKVRASEEGGNPLTDSAAVNLLVSGLRLLDHPDDMVSRFHLLHSPLTAEFGLGNSNWETGPGPVRVAAQAFRRQLLDEGFGKLLSGWAQKLDRFCTDRESYRMQQLIDRVTAFSSADHTRTRDLIRYLENTRIPDPSVSQVRVMTVHKAKGLEFDIVILPFLNYLTGKSPVYVCGRKHPTGPIGVVTRSVGEDYYPFLPASAVEAIKSNYASRVHEALCTAYVALTRAKYASYVLLPGNIKPENKSIGSMILAALGVKTTKEGHAAGTVLWSSGDPEWQVAEEGPEKSGDAIHDSGFPSDSGSPELVEMPIRFAPGSSRRVVTRSSPSIHLTGHAVRLSDWFESSDNEGARRYGSLLHACFEEIAWIEEYEFDEARLNDRLRALGPLDSETSSKAIADFQEFLKKPDLRKLLSREETGKRLGMREGDELVVEREYRFAVRQGNELLSGTMDRLVVATRVARAVSAEVVDFKMDRLESGSPTDVARRLGEYEQQVLSYRRTAASLFELEVENIAAYLVFPAIDRVTKIG
jgi:ATP-dependent helicase/nuclease subunit A